MTGDDPWKTVREHAALVASAVGVALVAIRLWSVASFDQNTAFAVLAAQGSANVIVGTLLFAVAAIPLFCWSFYPFVSAIKRPLDEI
jgi:hypothetical protein